MIPRALPKLMADAVRNGWNVHTAHPERDDRSFRLSCHRDGDVVFIVWIPDGLGSPGEAPWRVWKSSINGTATPYSQCTRLIRSPEGA